MSDQAGHRRPTANFRLDGLYGQVLKHGRSILTNAPAERPGSIGTPAGHPALTAFLGVPLVDGDRTIGLIAVGNRDGGYREADRESLEGFGSGHCRGPASCPGRAGAAPERGATASAVWQHYGRSVCGRVQWRSGPLS